MVERRKFKRIPANMMVRCKRFTANPEYTPGFPATTKNISGGGICFYTYNELKVFDKLRIEVTINAQKILKFIGQVVWVKKDSETAVNARQRFEVGIRIINIEPKDLEDLNKYTFFYFFNSKHTSSEEENNEKK